jgi:hypothetical protein
LVAKRIELLGKNKLDRYSKENPEIIKNRVKVYHGTKYKFLSSIMITGLKKPGDKDSLGKTI